MRFNKKINIEAWRNDLKGGLVSAALAIPLVMGYGMFAFTALGDNYFSYGALAGLYAAIVVGLVCLVLGDRTMTIYAPRITTTFFLGALLYQLLNSDTLILLNGNFHLIILVFFSIILLGGLFQALFGLVRLGSLIRFTPYPVMAGLRNAAAILLFLVQLGNVCGFDHNTPFTSIIAHLMEVKPLSLGIALVTFMVMWNARLITTKIPPLLVALGIGTALYFILIQAGFSSRLGPIIGMPSTVESPTPLSIINKPIPFVELFELLPLIVSGALALAFVAAMDALLCAKLVTPMGSKQVDGNQLLIRLGFGNFFSACFGGITSGINIGPSVANRAFGAKTAFSVLINITILFLVSSILFPILSHLPRVVLSACIMVIAVQHVDPWSLDLIRHIRLRASRNRNLMLLDLLVVVVVAILSIITHIVLAVFLGVVIAVGLFILRMSHSNIRRMYRCDLVHSRKQRTPEEAAFLQKQGAGILVLELQGVLFFGSAEMLSDDIQRLSAVSTRTIILDLRRITEIDATGAQILADIQRTLAHNKQRLAITVNKTSDASACLFEMGTIGVVGVGCVFEDIDRAVEWAEDELLLTCAEEFNQNEIPFEKISLLSMLSCEEIERLKCYTRQVMYSQGEIIFHQGEPGKELFILIKGRVSAYLCQPNSRDIRLMTFAPGTVFGELAILDSGFRSASVVAEEAIFCHVLSEEQFALLSKDNPAIAIKLLSSLGRELSRRLRQANGTIALLET